MRKNGSEKRSRVVFWVVFFSAVELGSLHSTSLNKPQSKKTSLQVLSRTTKRQTPKLKLLALLIIPTLSGLFTALAVQRCVKILKILGCFRPLSDILTKSTG